jgi:hypothetical protein
MEEQLYDILWENDGYPEKYKHIRKDYIFGHNTDLESLYKKYGVTDPRSQRAINSFFRWAEKYWEGESNAIRHKESLDDSDSSDDPTARIHVAMYPDRDPLEERIAKYEEARKLIMHQYHKQGNKHTPDQMKHLESINYELPHMRTELDNRRK